MPRDASELTSEQLTAALDTLGPGSRALLDLTFRRGFPDDELSVLLDVSRNEVIVRRVGALAQVADKLDLREDAEIERMTERLAELPASAWTTATPPPEPAEELREREPIKAAKPRQSAPRSRRWVGIAAGLILLAGGATAAILIATDDDDKKNGETAAGTDTGTTTEPTETTATTDTRTTDTTEPAQPPAKKLEPLAGGSGEGSATARLTGASEPRLELDVKDLPDPAGGEYGVWLFSTVADAKRLDSQSSGTFEARLDLPADAADYEFLDISLEPRDGNPNPSGETVLRVPVDELLQR